MLLNGEQFTISQYYVNLQHFRNLPPIVQHQQDLNLHVCKVKQLLRRHQLPIRCVYEPQLDIMHKLMNDIISLFEAPGVYALRYEIDQKLRDEMVKLCGILFDLFDYIEYLHY
jgi:hypothetical protein